MPKLIPANNWFATLDPWSGEPHATADTLEIYRVVLWQETKTGVVGLISPELNCGVLKLASEVMPFQGTVYKHFDDLNELELEALKLKQQRQK